MTAKSPGDLKGKQVRVRTTGPDVYSGKLTDIVEYKGKTFLVLGYPSTESTTSVNLDHIVSIEEKS